MVDAAEELGLVLVAVGIPLAAAGMAGVGLELRKAQEGTVVFADQETVASLVTGAARALAREGAVVSVEQKTVASLVPRAARAVLPPIRLGPEEKAAVEAMGGCPRLVTAEADAVVAKATAGVLGAGCRVMEVMVGAASAPPATRNGLLLHRPS